MEPPARHPDLDELLMEYLRGDEVGRPPDLEALASRLPDETSRDELRALVATAEWAQESFPVPFKPRTVIADRYVLREELGSGGFGRVWRATDQRLGRDVALKLFHPLMDDDKLESTLRRERDSLARVNHEGIMRLLDSGRHDDTHFLAMEYVPGNTLDKVLAALAARGPGARPDRTAVAAAIGGEAPTGEATLLEDDWDRCAARIMVSVLWALAAAHSQEIYHRDLKPGNILLRPGGRPVLLDFGLAGLGDLAEGTLTGRLFGTAAYLAPEQIEKMRTGKDAHVDLYQCGLLLYELLTFRRAFEESERTSLLEAVRRGVLVSPLQVRADVPPKLSDICMRALERRPEHRYPTADAFRDDLERWLLRQVPDAARFGRAGRQWRRARRWAFLNRVPVMVTAILLLGAGSTAWFAFRPEPIAVQVLDDGSYEVTAASGGMLCAWRAHLDAGGACIGLDPLRIQVATAEPALQARVEGGRSTLRLIERADLNPLPGTVRTELRWFLAADDAEARSWGILSDEVQAAARRDARPVSSEAVRAIAGQLLTKGPGGGGIGRLPIDELLR